MSQENVANAQRVYAALNRAYRSGDVGELRPVVEAYFDPEIVHEPAGVFPETAARRGWDGFLRHTAKQMEAFEDGSMWIEPLEYIDAGDRLVVPGRFGGVARHTGMNMEFSFANVITTRDGKAVRSKTYKTKAQALEAVGLRE